MAGTGKQIDFTSLWGKLPPQSHEVWKYSTPGLGRHRNKRWREVYQLLCGALWHLELAAEMGDFSTESMGVLLDGSHLPWEDCLDQSHGLSVKPSGSQLTIQYNFSTNSIDRPKIFMQTLLLADGALRLACAWELLKGLDKDPYFDANDLLIILNKSGRFKSSILDHTKNFKSPSDSKKLRVLIILAFRDSFMHGEVDQSIDKQKKRVQNNANDQNALNIRKRRMFRELWFKGQFEPFIDYSPAVIAEACREVSEELITTADSYVR